MKESLFKLMNKYNVDWDEALKIANTIINNNLIIKYKYLPQDLNDPIEVLKYDNDFNWNIEYGAHTNMAMLHLHAWEPLNYLVLAYHYSGKQQYLDKCIELARSWYQTSLNDNHKYLYYTHCVADRTLILSYLLLCNLKSKDRELLNALIETHKEYLLNEKNYVKYNHGTMMDRSLSALLVTQGDFQTLEKIVERLRHNITNTFTDNMICVENSLTYALFNLEIIITLQKEVFDFYNIQVIQDFDNKIKKAFDFLNILKKPDNRFPMYGDGELVTVENLRSSILFNYYPEHKLFSYSDHQDSIISTHYYKDEGYLIIKCDADKFHFFIRVGDIVKNHKHGDDLSFTLYNQGEIFIDPGTYNYDKGEVRDYLKASLSHNSLILNNEEYSHINSNREDIFIQTFKEHDNHFHIAIKHLVYPFANILRNIFILKDDYTLIIIDNVSAPIKINTTQQFNLSEEFIKEFSVNSIDDKIIINNKLLIQSLNIDSINTSFNQTNYYSELFQQLKYIPKIEIIKNIKHPTVLTVVSTNIDNNIINSIKSQPKNSLKFLYNNNNYYLDCSNEKDNIVIDNYLFFTKNETTYSFETFALYYEEQEYAWYIYKDEIRHDIIWYQKSPRFTYTFDEPGNYRIRCFIRNEKDKSKKREFSSKKQIKITID